MSIARRPLIYIRGSRRNAKSAAADEAFVGWVSLEGGEELIDLLISGHGEESAPERGDGFDLDLGHEFLFLARAAFCEVDRGEGASFGDLAVEDEFHVARALELFEDDLVGGGAGVDEATCDDGEAAGFFGVSRGTEDLAGDFESLAIEAAGHGSA